MAGTIAFVTTEEIESQWLSELLRQDPQLNIKIWPEVGIAEDVEYAIVAKPPADALGALPNLKAVLSMWAGVEDLLSDPKINHLPIVRMIEPGLTNGIVSYVVHHVTGFHIHTDAYADRNWIHPFHTDMRVTNDTAVGILGLGTLGQACAEALVSLGFEVAGFSNTRKQIAGVKSFAGASELPSFLRGINVLVSILPRTPDTNNLINAETLAMLPAGSCVINCGRGEVIDDEHLIDAIRTGHIGKAVLDVFRQEPLPDGHPFWHEPSITVTPHCASKPDPRTGAKVILQNLERLKRGEPLPPGHLAQTGRGY